MSIKLTNISKTYGSFKAVDDVSLCVPYGQLTALLGPSGSGKTTLLRIISGLEQADPGSGAILFHEEDMAQTPVRYRRVGFVFQHYALFRHMTVFDNVAFGLKVRRRIDRPSKQQISNKVHELLKLVQLDAMANRFPSQLSGGQRQRVALARALAVEPKVLLLDEPFGSLDAKVRKELRTWLRRLHDEIHVTSVFVTHDQDEALEVADQVVVMNQGRIEQMGTPDEVFHHPATEFVMRFLGEVNAFHGRFGKGSVLFDTLELPYQQSQQIAGDAQVFVRPHDVTIETKANGQPTVSARVVRIHSAGPVVRLELETVQGQHRLTAELSQEHFETMAITLGSEVFVRPRHIRVFAGNPPPTGDHLPPS